VPCPLYAYQTSALVLPCGGGSGVVIEEVQKGHGVEILRLLPGMRNISVQVSAEDVDADLQVIDRDAVRALQVFVPMLRNAIAINAAVGRLCAV